MKTALKVLDDEIERVADGMINQLEGRIFEGLESSVQIIKELAEAQSILREARATADLSFYPDVVPIQAYDLRYLIGYQISRDGKKPLGTLTDFMETEVAHPADSHGYLCTIDHVNESLIAPWNISNAVFYVHGWYKKISIDELEYMVYPYIATVNGEGIHARTTSNHFIMRDGRKIEVTPEDREKGVNMLWRKGLDD